MQERTEEMKELLKKITTKMFIAIAIGTLLYPFLFGRMLILVWKMGVLK